MKRSISLVLCLAVLALAACGSDDAAKVGTKTYTSTDVPKAIPDNNVTGASSTITVDDGPTALAKTTVKVYISHGMGGDDLDLDLVSPAGSTIRLYSGALGQWGDHFIGTGFDDAAAMSSTNLAATDNTGTYRPIQALATFNGQTSVGIWRLKATDTIIGITGSITNWSLTVTD